MLSVVIPVLNGMPGLVATLAGVADGADEIVVVDGGSTDGSAVAAVAAGARAVAAPRGRGPQLAAGARAA
ncbi:MAG: glycosyltransferase, partial [Alphaproteobacteria bacterium]